MQIRKGMKRMLNHKLAASQPEAGALSKIDETTALEVLFLTNLPAPYRVEFFNELAKKCQLTVVFERFEAEDREKAWYGNNMQFKHIFLNGIRVGREASFSGKICSIIKNYKTAIIIVGVYSTPTAMLAIEYMKLHAIPFWISADGGMVKQEHVWKRWMKKHFIGSAAYYLSSGAQTDAYLMHYGAKRENIAKYPFTSLRQADLQKRILTEEEKLQLRSKLGLKTEGRLILAIGQFIYRKGFELLLQAVKGTDYEVVLIGGKITEEYKSYLTPKVHVMEFMDKEALGQYYKAADVFVLPTREDIWGLVINEAMAYGLPVITTDQCVAGLELVQNEKNGYIVPVDDIDKLRNKIRRVLENEALRKAMAQQSLKRIQDYTIEHMAAVTWETIENYVNQRNKS